MAVKEDWACDGCGDKLPGQGNLKITLYKIEEHVSIPFDVCQACLETVLEFIDPKNKKVKAGSLQVFPVSPQAPEAPEAPVPAHARRRAATKSK